MTTLAERKGVMYHASVLLQAVELLPEEGARPAGAVARGRGRTGAPGLLEAAVVQRTVLRVPRGRPRPLAELSAVGVEARAVPGRRRTRGAAASVGAVSSIWGPHPHRAPVGQAGPAVFLRLGRTHGIKGVVLSSSGD